MTAMAAMTLLRDRLGTDPLLLSRGPGRANLIGEHTDYNDGLVLPFAIDRSTVAALHPRTDRRIRLATDFSRGVVEADLDSLDSIHEGWSRYPLGVVWAMGEAGVDLSDLTGFDIAFASDVPVGAGLSSSAALESATAVALDHLWGLGLDRMTLAKIGQRAENAVVGAPTGIMDQTASLLGRTDSAVLLDCRSLVVTVVPLGLAEAGLRVLVIDTRVSHAHADGGYGSRRASCEEGALALQVPALRDLGVGDLGRAAQVLDEVTFRRVRHVITENARVQQSVATIIESGPRAIGELLLASHVSLRDDFEVSVAELDTAVEATMAAGAIGARMTGGGFGGSAIALVDVDLLPQVSAAAEAAFDAAGFTPPGLFVVNPSQGAELI